MCAALVSAATINDDNAQSLRDTVTALIAKVTSVTADIFPCLDSEFLYTQVDILSSDGYIGRDGRDGVEGIAYHVQCNKST